MKRSIFSKYRTKKHLKNVALALLSLTLMSGPAYSAEDLVGPAVNNEGAKEALNAALKVARGKPALSVAATVVCISCIPVAGATVSASMCVACGILLAKTLG